VIELLTQFTKLLSAVVSLLKSIAGQKKRPDTSVKTKPINVEINHSHPKFRFRALDEHQIEILLGNKDRATNSFRYLDWTLFGSNQFWAAKPKNHSLGKTNLIPPDGLLLEVNIEDILSSYFLSSTPSYFNLYEIIKNIMLRIKLVSGEESYVPLPPSLKVALLYKHCARSKLLWFYEALLLRT
jgi:hypothetical protein